MRRVRYSVAMSLDGYIAGPQGEFDWITVDPEIDFQELSRSFDTLLMGRKSYEMSQGQGGGGMPGMQVVVISRTLKPGDCPGAIVSSDVQATVNELKQQTSDKDIWLWGGGELFRSLLDHGLVDSVEVAVVPILLGGGIPLLPPLAARANLRLADHKIYAQTGTVLLSYEILR
jgi:dihydrofolate reductase